MLSNFNEKLDKSTCAVSLILFTLITFAVSASNLYSLFNMSGVFKQ